MTTIDEYMELYMKKDPKLMDRVGMDKDQKESVNSPCKWTVAVLERMGSDIQDGRLVIDQDNKYRLANIMRYANNDCRRCKDC